MKTMTESEYDAILRALIAASLALIPAERDEARAALKAIDIAMAIMRVLAPA